jgi:hypothetical protein
MTNIREEGRFVNKRMRPAMTVVPSREGARDEFKKLSNVPIVDSWGLPVIILDLTGIK